MFRKLLNPFSFAARRVKLTSKEYLIYGGAGLLLLVLAASYGLEIKWYKRYLEAGRLLLSSLIGGAVLGVLLGFAFRQMSERYRQQSFEPLERLQIHLITLLLCLFFAPLFGSWLNRGLSFGQASRVPFIYFEEQPYASSRYGYMKGEKIEPDGYYLYVVRDERLYRFDLPKSVASDLKRGDTIELPIRRGALGFSFLDSRHLYVDNQ